MTTMTTGSHDRHDAADPLSVSGLSPIISAADGAVRKLCPLLAPRFR